MYAFCYIRTPPNVSDLLNFSKLPLSNVCVMHIQRIMESASSTSSNRVISDALARLSKDDPVLHLQCAGALPSNIAPPPSALPRMFRKLNGLHVLIKNSTPDTLTASEATSWCPCGISSEMRNLVAPRARAASLRGRTLRPTIVLTGGILAPWGPQHTTQSRHGGRCHESYYLLVVLSKDVLLVAGNPVKTPRAYHFAA